MLLLLLSHSLSEVLVGAPKGIEDIAIVQIELKIFQTADQVQWQVADLD